MPAQANADKDDTGARNAFQAVSAAIDGDATNALASMARRVSEYDGEITAYEPPRRMEIKMTGGCFKAGTEVYADYRLVPEGVARTRVDYECRFVTDKVFVKLMGFLFRWCGKLQAKKLFANLRRLVEGQAVAAR